MSTRLPNSYLFSLILSTLVVVGVFSFALVLRPELREIVFTTLPFAVLANTILAVWSWRYWNRTGWLGSKKQLEGVKRNKPLARLVARITVFIGMVVLPRLRISLNGRLFVIFSVFVIVFLVEQTLAIVLYNYLNLPSQGEYEHSNCEKLR